MEASFRLYRGPNPFTPGPAAHLNIALGPLIEVAPGDGARAFAAAMTAVLPPLRDDADFTRAAETGGNLLGRAILSAAALFQRMAGADVAFAELRGGAAAGRCDLLCSCESDVIAGQAFALARRLTADLARQHLGAALESEGDFDFERAMKRFLARTAGRAWRYDVKLMIRAAEARGIPWFRLGGDKFMLGQGRHQHWFRDASTERTSYVAASLATPKNVASWMLGNAGLPVPAQRTADDAGAAAAAAGEIGYPVVVKPLTADSGVGITVGLTAPGAVEKAFAKAVRHSSRVLVEKFIDGEDHRLLVVGGKMVAAAKRLPGRVTGDGTHTIRELVEILNRDPRRREREEAALAPLVFDDEAKRYIAEAGLTPDTVPKPGETVVLRGTANLATGGTSVDVTGLVHPDNRDMAVRAARVVRLDVCGVDFITPDIARSYREVGGAICEVNLTPSLGVHHDPAEGEARDAAGAVVEFVFPPGAPSRVPVAAILGAAGSGVAAKTAAILGAAGRLPGVAARGGLYLAALRFNDGDGTAPGMAGMLLRNPEIDAAVVEIAPRAVAEAGLDIDRCDVAAILDAAGDPAPARVLAALATAALVLDADDPACLALRDANAEARLILVSGDPEEAAIRDHLAAGGRAVVWRGASGGGTVIHDGNGNEISLPGDKEAAWAGAVALGLGIAPELVRAGSGGESETAAAVRTGPPGNP
jgi:cyanophycin synthetase